LGEKSPNVRRLVPFKGIETPDEAKPER